MVGYLGVYILGLLEDGIDACPRVGMLAELDEDRVGLFALHEREEEGKKKRRWLSVGGWLRDHRVLTSASFVDLLKAWTMRSSRATSNGCEKSKRLSMEWRTD